MGPGLRSVPQIKASARQKLCCGYRECWRALASTRSVEHASESNCLCAIVDLRRVQQSGCSPKLSKPATQIKRALNTPLYFNRIVMTATLVPMENLT